jgi:hypothetical protein
MVGPILEVHALASKRKVSVTLDESVIQQIRERAGDGHFSKWLNDAAILMLQNALVDDIIKEHGIVLTPELLAEVDAEWPTRV